MNYAWSKYPEVKRFETVSLYDNPEDYSTWIKGLEPTQKLATRVGRLAYGEMNPVDIAAYCNSSIVYSSHQTNALSGLKTYSGVPYRFSKDANGNAITVRSDESLNPTIPISSKAKELIFMHFLRKQTDTYKKTRKTVGDYIVNYADGSVLKIPLFSGINIRHYTGQDLATGYTQQSEDDIIGAFGETIPMINGKVWASYLGFDEAENGPVIYQSYAWENPHPDKQIESIQFSSTDDANIATIALTVIE